MQKSIAFDFVSNVCRSAEIPPFLWVDLLFPNINRADHEVYQLLFYTCNSQRIKRYVPVVALNEILIYRNGGLDEVYFRFEVHVLFSRIMKYFVLNGPTAYC